MTDERLKVLGRNIKAERVRKNISQMQLAEIIDRSKDTISKIETGNQSPSALIVYDIAKALNVPIEEIIKSLDK